MDMRPNESAALMFFGLILAAGAYLGAGLEAGAWKAQEILVHLKAHGVGPLFWVILALSVIPAVFVFILIFKSGEGGNTAGAHMVTYRQVAGSLGHDAAVKAARKKAKISMPPVSPDWPVGR